MGHCRTGKVLFLTSYSSPHLRPLSIGASFFESNTNGLKNFCTGEMYCSNGDLLAFYCNRS